MFPNPTPIECAIAANANIEADPARGIYRIVPPGRGKHLNHFARCPEARNFKPSGLNVPVDRR